MADNTALRSNNLNALNEWTLHDPAIREDAFIEVDLLEDSVKFIDADQLIKYDLEEPAQRRSFSQLFYE